MVSMTELKKNQTYQGVSGLFRAEWIVPQNVRIQSANRMKWPATPKIRTTSSPL